MLHILKGRLGILVILLAALILCFSAAAYPMSVINLGFEGAKCHFYGSDFRFQDNSHFSGGSWEGTNQVHAYQSAEECLCRKAGSAGGQYWDMIQWGNIATPNDATITWEFGEGWVFNRKRMPDLGVHVQSNIQLQDINRQGDPLEWNSTDLMSGRRIEYWSKTAVADETEDKVLYHWECTKETFLLVPAEFWVGFYLVPSQSYASGATGWREGEWQNIVNWFRLDFNVWDNAYQDPWLNDPEVNVFNTEYDGIVLNTQKTWDYRGGFPIAGWIQGWEKAGFTSDTQAGQQFSPLWFDLKGKVEQSYTIDQLVNLKETLQAKCSFSPSLIGQFITLYNEPNGQFSYQLSEQDFSNAKLSQEIKAPDSAMKKTMYFPVNVNNFGTYAEGNFWDGWTVYYPSCYFRIRMIYGVYGTFKYLWTEEVTKPMDQGGLDYPETIERHGTIVVRSPGLREQLGGFLWIIIAVIIIIIIVGIIVSMVFGLGILRIFMGGGG